ncbi:response regulator transcription factor [Billgrantia diversa]|uniref:response regulator transcription factor n=1 Tax=Halomonas sp. MCCC 1A13316 TaxID=2733487 RepID=UPI0018A57B44|nr:response regulator transcription factor [Halomonas sp. MCCC 1A13316]QOR39135.1 response regulator transcription factor [Halomonas sp. MCCC 1A13316]
MMAVLFISQRRADIPRLHSAFPDVRRINPDQARVMVDSGDRVWLMTDHLDWPVLSAMLAAQGAIVVVMSLAPSEAEALKALQAGARGYIHALSPPELLGQVALVTSNQGVWVPAELLSKVIGVAFTTLGGHESLPQGSLSALTERERAVALAVAEGRTNKEVARQLDITERTVKAHLGAVFRKLGVRDRMQLVLSLSRQDVNVA